MDNLSNRFNWMALTIGLFVGLFVSLIFEFSNGYNALLVAPFLNGLISVYLAK